CRHVQDKLRMLVVPSERNRAAGNAKRRTASGHVDPFDGRWRCSHAWCISRGPPLVIVRKLVPPVEHRLLVHCFVLQDGERRFGAVELRMAGAIEILARKRIEYLSVRFSGK